MEIGYDFSEIFPSEPIQRLDRAQLYRFNPRKFWSVQKAIDTLGHLSTEAQGLKRILTTYEKVLNQPEDQFIYLMWQRHPSKPLVFLHILFVQRFKRATSYVIGMLKVGKKHLYLLDENQKKYEEEPLCILDFYIHDSVQRRGNGHQLFEAMLREESTSAAAVAIDRPSDAFLQFLSKFYGLSKPVWQSTNFVVFPEFFEGKAPVERYDKSGNGCRSEKFGTRKNATQNTASETTVKDTVAGLLHGNLTPELRRVAAPDTPLDRKNRRDFGHQSLW
ncbi:hypothetical protein NECAME_01566 [Necator americanus]|uniref:Alpha-tubulin N-acetyltransferase n=1 Tax=Necator americanus TaxID=51031 RepID=W2TTM1_NECAM|nr:hypothetical protein NECAME_01566 [Necator americanus]ETN85004.1 hypothetical protein NECAME_01566 [Necator americanus]